MAKSRIYGRSRMGTSFYHLRKRMLLSSPSLLKNIKTTKILCPLHLPLGKLKLFSKRGIEKFTPAKSLIVSDVSATTVAFFSKDKNANV